ncbi:hypothetical protein [Halomonas elongata]|uniref:hypothetical protein n=1 Tax=Halomonas elongata TaxID=2746 RepID=UPI00186B8202|nr:hypothetical protein [Halomonas elongata]MBW5800092.1 hypothetical protein [Halomonas elongata]
MTTINKSELLQLDTRRFSEDEIAPFVRVTPAELELIDETNRLQRQRLELAVTGPVLARLRCDLRYHQAMTQLLAQTEAWDDDAQVRINGRRLMHQFFASHYQHELEQLEETA